MIAQTIARSIISHGEGSWFEYKFVRQVCDTIHLHTHIYFGKRNSHVQVVYLRCHGAIASQQDHEIFAIFTICFVLITAVR